MIKITKLVHSCVLVEKDGYATLFDPGMFSWQSGLVDISKLPDLNEVVVTHKHGDHMSEDFVRALVDRFSDVQWFAPSDAHQDLRSWGVKNVANGVAGEDSDSLPGGQIHELVISEGDHAPVEPFGVQVANIQAHWKGVLTHPGDTHQIHESKSILLLPVQAPWGSTVEAFRLPIELAKNNELKYIIPIHDWMWNDQWRNHVYGRLDAVFKDSGITVIHPENGRSVQIDL